MKNKIDFKKIDVKKIGGFISENKKPLLYIGGAVAVVTIGVVIVKSFKGGIEDFFNPGKNTIGGKFVTQTVDGSKLTISQETASNYAEALFEAFNSTYGTDTSVIKSIFSKINSDDFKLIYNIYGKRSYSSINGGSPSDKWWAIDTWIGNINIDLVQWLNKEFDIFDYSTKKIVKKVIEPAGFILS